MRLEGRLHRMEFFLFLSVVLIISSIIVTVYHVRQKREATDLVIHTYNVIQIGEEIYSELLELENERILFYVQGDTTVKTSFAIARVKLQRDLERLRDMVELPEAEALVNNEIIPLISTKLIKVKIDTVKTQPTSENFSYQVDQRLMQQVQGSFKKLEAIKRSALIERQQNLDQIYDFSNFFLFVSFGLVGITSLIAWANLRSRQKEIDHLLKSLREWNLSLERKVDERTKETTSINQELLTLNEEKDNFIGIVSHDLKSPITGIQNLVQLMKTHGSSPEQKEYLDLILESCHHMQQLIAEILDVNRIDQGLQSVVLKKISINELIIRLHKSFEVLAQEKDIMLQLELPNEEIICTSDEAILYQILSNLLSNAIKFSKNKSQVELSVAPTSNGIIFKVTDHGPGIDPEEIPLLFKKFQKLKARPTQGETSTGLGLFIVNRLTYLLKGKLEVESEPNKQTSFIVTIPV